MFQRRCAPTARAPRSFFCRPRACVPPLNNSSGATQVVGDVGYLFYLLMTFPHCRAAAPPRGCSPGLPSHGPAWPQDVALTDVARAAAGPRVAAVARALGILPTAAGGARLPGRAPTSWAGTGRVGGGEAVAAAESRLTPMPPSPRCPRSCPPRPSPAAPPAHRVRLWTAAESPFPQGRHRATIPIAVGPAVQFNPFYPADPRPGSRVGSPWGSPDKGFFVMWLLACLE